MLKKEYEHGEIEKKWLERWDDSIYYFDRTSEAEPYIIDTPPPYPTGDFHIGNALNWCYIDFIARYKRMRGYNVMFPQGWDCHGLPTEVKVEERHGITKNQVSRAEFRRLCRELTLENIKKMKETMRRLGMSIDWSQEYITMEDYYKKFVQHTFVKLFKEGLIYKTEHPVNWCPRCETAIAFAEVEYDDRETFLNYLKFKLLDGNYVEIATTRPELLPSCVAVAVHPNDERYRALVGKEVEVPIFSQVVRIFADESVDPSFGTGVVMICTFGDRQDVRWWKEHELPLRRSIDEQGKMTELAGEYKGLSVEEARCQIIEDLRAHGLLTKQERLQQSVGVCWRCKTPIEILSTEQWFLKVDSERVVDAARRVRWVPEHFFLRLKNWAESLEWDWCISRQRIFATPIPIWYCKKCGNVVVASYEELPIDPLEHPPRVACERCGSTEFEGETDVLDTWMDSSVTALWVGGWRPWAGNGDGSNSSKFKPTALRPQGHDIIRTWAFYTILRTLLLTNEMPWETIVINGMVLGEDGYKMSKSRNNIVAPEEVIEKYGADAFRQWAAIGGAVGSDVQFRWKDVVAARRFLQKLWSILRFSLPHLEDFTPPEDDVKTLRTVDRWLLVKLSKLVADVTECMDAFKFDEAMRRIRTFCWSVLADSYIELVKARLYGRFGDVARNSARTALYITLKTVSILLAPFTPFFAEEMYSRVTQDRGRRSVHLERWPSPLLYDDDAERKGDVLNAVAAAVRKYKAERGMPLNAPLGRLELYSDVIDKSELDDLASVTVAEIELKRASVKAELLPVRVVPKPNIIGPRFRAKTKDLLKALAQADPKIVDEQLQKHGKFVITVGGEPLELDDECVEVERSFMLSGKAVDILEVSSPGGSGTVVVVERER